MKIFFQILIIVFVCVSLFIIKDDVETVYIRAVSYIADKSNLIPSTIKNNIIIKSDNKILSNTVNTPGTLHVTEGLSANVNSVKLSIKDVINWTNKNRLLNGNLVPLKENSKLDFSAQIKINDMFKQQYFEHISPDNIGIVYLSKEVSYDYITIGENLALGNFKDAEALLNAWMASQGHRDNILNKHYTDIGVAVGHGMFKGQDTWIAVQHFGLPKDACPLIDEILYGKIILDQKQAKIMEADLNLRHSQINKGVIYNGKTTNEQINEYNNLVEVYNQLIGELKQKVFIYNKSIKLFNTCLSNST